MGSRTFYTNGKRALPKAQEMVVFDTTLAQGKTQIRVSHANMWPCHFVSSDLGPTLPGYNHHCRGNTEFWEKAEPT